MEKRKRLWGMFISALLLAMVIAGPSFSGETATEQSGETTLAQLDKKN